MALLLGVVTLMGRIVKGNKG